MTQQHKKSLIIAIVITAVILVTTVGLVLTFTQSDGMKVRALGHYDHGKISEYTNSRLYLYSNGTFKVYIIHGNEESIFSGIGIYKKSGKTYQFTYIDAWVRIDDPAGVIFKRDDEDKYIDKMHTYNITSRSRIEFIDDNERRYYFS